MELSIKARLLFRNPDNYNQTREVPVLKMFIAGEKVYQGPAVDWYGNRYVYKEGNLEYSASGTTEENPPMVGRVFGGKFPCYKLQVTKVTAEKLEERALTYQFVQIIPESYEIEKEKYKPEVPGEWQIEKIQRRVQRERVATVTPLNWSHKKRKTGGSGATVTVFEYKESGALEWRLTMEVSVMS